MLSDAVGAVTTVRLLLLSDVGLVVVLSGPCQVLSGGAVGVLLSGSDTLSTLMTLSSIEETSRTLLHIL